MTQAGSHADQSTFLHFNTTTNGTGDTIMDGQVRDITVDLPAGFYGNPQVMATCTMQQIIEADGYCQPAAQVGVLNLMQVGEEALGVARAGLGIDPRRQDLRVDQHAVAIKDDEHARPLAVATILIKRAQSA